MDSFKVVLEGPAPWGFRLQGGKDFNVPLSISRLTPGGKASQAGVAVGDWVLSIDGENAGGLTHIEAQNKIRACGERLSLGLSRAQPAQSKPQKVGNGRGTCERDIWVVGGVGLDYWADLPSLATRSLDTSIPGLE